MSQWLLIAPFIVTSAYAIYEMRRSRRHRRLAASVLISAAMMVACLVGLEPVLFSLHEPSSYDPLGDAIGLSITALIVEGVVFVTHFVLLGCLMWKTEPDLPNRDA